MTLLPIIVTSRVMDEVMDEDIFPTVRIPCKIRMKNTKRSKPFHSKIQKRGIEKRQGSERRDSNCAMDGLWISERGHHFALQKAYHNLTRKMTQTRAAAAAERKAGKQPMKRKSDEMSMDEEDEEYEVENVDEDDEDYVEASEAEEDDQVEDVDVQAEEEVAEDAEELVGDADGSQANCEEGDYVCYYPMEKLFFDSWEEFNTYKMVYMKKTFSRIVIQCTDSAAYRNQCISKQARVVSGDVKPDFVPVELNPWRRLYHCTHSWKKKPRGKGKRPCQKYRGTSCPYRFTAEVMRTPDGSGWFLGIKNATWGHNHKCNSDVWSQYPENRAIPEWEPIWDNLRLMVDVGGKSVRIYEYIRDHTQYKVKMSDVHNLLSKLRHEKEGDDDVAVADYLMRFQQRHPGNCVGVDENARGLTGVLSMASNHMRTIFDRFPEMLLIDCTHKTNK